MTRIVPATVLALYTGLVAHLTLMSPASGYWAFSRADGLAALLSGGRMVWSQTETIANVALFVPVGFLLALTLRRVWPAVAIGLLGSMVIEATQYEFLPMRVGDVHDIVHNGYGVLIGALLAAPAVLRRRPVSYAGAAQ